MTDRMARDRYGNASAVLEPASQLLHLSLQSLDLLPQRLHLLRHARCAILFGGRQRSFQQFFQAAYGGQFAAERFTAARCGWGIGSITVQVRRGRFQLGCQQNSLALQFGALVIT